MMSEKTKILILAANPWDTKRLSLDEEHQRIQDVWESSPLEDAFEVHYYPALRGEKLQQRILKIKPHIIHFSGHGEENGLLFADPTGDKTHEVSKAALAQLLGICKDLKAVFLNACYSANQSDDMVAQVPFLVGMNAAINDMAAIRFSEGFYTAIFNQTTLDIEQAYQAGLNQMELTKIPEKEQKKPVLKKRILPFVPSCQSDVFICFADADKKWKEDFVETLQKKLKQGLYPEGSPIICSSADLNNIESSAMILLLTSGNFLQNHTPRLANFQALAKKQPIYLIEIESYTIPIELKGLSRHKFWVDDEQDGLVALKGDAYIEKSDQVADLMVKKLRELRSKHESQQRVEKEIRIEDFSSHSIIPASVFINSAPEDLKLTEQIKSLLKQQGVSCILLPMPRTGNPSPSEIREDMESKITGCDAMLVVCENTTPIWASKQIMDCLRLQRKRDMPFKIIALHRSERHRDLGIEWDVMKTYICPPQNIASYVPQFVGELK